MKHLVFIAGVLFVILSIAGCNTTEAPVTADSKDARITYIEEISLEDEKYVASLAVEGMACEMMCGNMISGALADLDGVQETEIDFNGAEEANFVLVEFDANKVSEKEMISAVEALADGHYKVNAVKVTHFKPSNTTSKEDSEKVSSYDPRIKVEIPNIFGVFSRLF
jgi:copper chaperone CopZ